VGQSLLDQLEGSLLADRLTVARDAIGLDLLLNDSVIDDRLRLGNRIDRLRLTGARFASAGRTLALVAIALLTARAVAGATWGTRSPGRQRPRLGEVAVRRQTPIVACVGAVEADLFIPVEESPLNRIG